MLKPELHKLESRYIVEILDDSAINGHAYLTQDALWKQVQRIHPSISETTYLTHRGELLGYGYLALEGQRFYLPKNLQYENTVAELLAPILQYNRPDKPELPETISLSDMDLTADQRDAVYCALSHDISLVLGGAGTGKTTLIRGILQQANSHVVLCAPTGKAAVNMTQRVGFPARTVHSALGKVPEENFISPIQWSKIGLIIVDEASMVTLEMLAGLLSVMNCFCQLVLVGDPNQLQSVGAGNVLPDLLKLGVPSHTLQVCHRQNSSAKALSYNVENFKNIRNIDQLQFDDSFQIVEETNPNIIKTMLCKDGADRYLKDENIQVLSPFNRSGQLSVADLNETLQPMVNPNPPIKDCPYRENDRVMITQNDWDRWIFNGQIGRIHLDARCPSYHQFLVDGRDIPIWDKLPSKHSPMALAYAITIHKSQASEWDTILIPLGRFSPIFTRNLIYTAISRAKNKVVLYGNPDVLQQALLTVPYRRNTRLVAKVKEFTKKYAS